MLTLDLTAIPTRQHYDAAVALQSTSLARLQVELAGDAQHVEETRAHELYTGQSKTLQMRSAHQPQGGSQGVLAPDALLYAVKAAMTARRLCSSSPVRCFGGQSSQVSGLRVREGRIAGLPGCAAHRAALSGVHRRCRERFSLAALWRTQQQQQHIRHRLPPIAQVGVPRLSVASKTNFDSMNVSDTHLQTAPELCLHMHMTQ